MVAILGAIALLVGVVLVAEPIADARATGPSSAPERGAGDTTEIELPPGVMTFEQAKAKGTLDDYDFGDRCDPATGTLALPLAPQQNCFAKFSGDNGGATATGVTAEKIKVVAYLNQHNEPILELIYGQIGLEKPGEAKATTTSTRSLPPTTSSMVAVEVIPHRHRQHPGLSGRHVDAETIARTSNRSP
jgi:hypothetical protein